MKYLPVNKTSVRFDWSMRAWKKRAIMFGVVNLITYIFLPGLFFGFYDMVGGLSAKMAHNRTYYHIRRTRGRTVADMWEKAFKGMNPMSWGK